MILDRRLPGMGAGADDYRTKPFELDELFARIRSLLWRMGDKAPVLKADGLELNPATRNMVFRGRPWMI